MTEPRPLRRPGRTPGSFNLGVALTVLVVLLPLLLNAATSAPPTAAEFSPNARQVIKKAPPGQAAAVNGTGEGAAPGAGGTGNGASPTPSPSAQAQPTPTGSPVPETEIKKCVGPPPLRQIEDPQSPPCIAYYKGDNGGATSRGVTRESVYIAVPTPENAQAQYDALFAFFNKRFQFYGRKLVPEYCDATKSGASDQATQVSDAATSASGCGGTKPVPFASTFYRQNNGAYYMPSMACTHKIIVVGSYSPYDSSFLNRCAGYQFQYPMMVDEEFANVGQWACRRLAGKKASYAAGNDSATPPGPLTAHTRKFGILLEPFTDDDPVARPASLNPMLAQLHACGVDVPSQDAIVNPVMGEFDPSTAQNALLQLKNDGVTSIICMCNFFSFGTLARAAESSAFQPEWISSTFGLNDVDSSFTLSAAPADQLAHTMGVTFQPRIIKPLENPYNVALAEGDPSQTPDTASTGEAKLEVYRALLLIASGIQMAGPHLTVESFRDGLRDTKFPNPITSTHAGAVDMKADGYSLTADGAEWYYGTTATGPFSDSAGHPGTVCYLNGGRRYRLGEWPTGDAPFFSSTCDSGA